MSIVKFSLCAVGSWINTNKNGTLETRQHNTSDQITSIAGETTTNDADAKGNLTDYEINGKDHKVKYDLNNHHQTHLPPPLVAFLSLYPL